MKNTFLLLLTILLSVTITSQERRTCYSNENLEYRKQKTPEIQHKMDLIEYHAQMRIQRMERFQNKQEEKPITIPVVVHIIYNNELENISDDQVQSQIDVLNEDFSKTTPYLTDKWPQAADVGIRFQLASEDPYGNSTKGITRKSSKKTSWGAQDVMKNSKSGGTDPWNTSEYLNIWVCNIGNGILGYAQYPGGKSETDGVVVNPKYFGSSDKGNNFYLSPPFDKGRTTTHEVGHFLNLRHTWGNSRSCDSDDLVTDTPKSNGPNYGCQTGTISCGSEDMVENFMDYSDDACMSVFTSGQKVRMHAVLMEGGFRHDLTKSNKFNTISTELFTPRNIMISELKSTEAHVSWDEVKGGSYVLRYRLVGAEDWNETFALQTSIVLRGLQDNSEYEMQIKSVSAQEESSYCEYVKFTTLEKDRYCVSKPLNANELYIDEFVIGGESNNSGLTEGYSDFISQTKELIKEHQINIEIKPKWKDDIKYDSGYAVFIDYNQDGDFDDEEEMVWKQEKTSKSLIEGSFFVPEFAVEGETRLRVIMKYEGVPDSCGVFDYGEVEDYTVIITKEDHDKHEYEEYIDFEVLGITTTSIKVNLNHTRNRLNVLGYEVYLNNQLYGTVKAPQIEFLDLEPETDYIVGVKSILECPDVDVEVFEVSVSTLKNELLYCDSRGQKSTYEWIDKVEIGEISNYSNSNDGYADFTALETNLIRGVETPIVVSAGFLSFTYTEFWSVWIDFNQDGSFSDEEKVVYGSSNSREDLYGMINIPETALLGKTRMRVSMKYKSIQTSCEFFSEGEVEDYTINIIDDQNSGDLKEADITGAFAIGEVDVLKITAYPNPTIDYINVVLDEKQEHEVISYNIINSKGQIVKSNNVNDLRIDISNLTSGVYIFEFFDGQKRFQTKIVRK
ncbi:GEVED domain-containing protein [Tenacibaculum sp. ZS6-P6]|uniref:GEVED domain-containing protein n=1 Tax=Tenacibaculum sp. ZS6-P6 TaxID=3447503 RepID=UPI003F98D369